MHLKYIVQTDNGVVSWPERLHREHPPSQRRKGADQNCFASISSIKQLTLKDIHIAASKAKAGNGMIGNLITRQISSGFQLLKAPEITPVPDCKEVNADQPQMPRQRQRQSWRLNWWKLTGDQWLSPGMNLRNSIRTNYPPFTVLPITEVWHARQRHPPDRSE